MNPVALQNSSQSRTTCCGHVVRYKLVCIYATLFVLVQPRQAVFEEAFHHEELLLSDKPGARFWQTERCCVLLSSNRIHRMHCAIMLSSKPKFTYLRQANFLHQRAVLRLTYHQKSFSSYSCCTAPHVPPPCTWHRCTYRGKRVDLCYRLGTLWVQ